MIDEKYIANAFGLKKEEISNLVKKDRIRLSEEDETLFIEIDEKKYKNAFSKYREILDKYYPKPWRVFVIAKVKIPNRFESFLNVLFKNSKKAVASEMNGFSPSFLLSRGDLDLLVSIQLEKIEISRIEKGAGEKRFIHRGYRFAIANEIKR